MISERERCLSVPVVPVSLSLLRAKSAAGEARKEVVCMTEELFFHFFMLWTLTNGFNELYVKTMTASAYIWLKSLCK